MLFLTSRFWQKHLPLALGFVLVSTAAASATTTSGIPGLDTGGTATLKVIQYISGLIALGLLAFLAKEYSEHKKAFNIMVELIVIAAVGYIAVNPNTVGPLFGVTAAII